MNNEFTFYIISATGDISKEDCTILNLTLLDGEIGIMKDHEDLIAPFETQNIRYITSSSIGREIKVSCGVIRISNGNVKLLVDSYQKCN